MQKKRCRKIRYGSKQLARKALKDLRCTGAKRFYLCPYCKNGIFHLTSELKDEKRE